MHQIPETAITGGDTGISGVPIRILSSDGDTSRVLTEGPGIHVGQGEVHTVPTAAIRPCR
jgi:hypothetical protein